MEFFNINFKRLKNKKVEEYLTPKKPWNWVGSLDRKDPQKVSKVPPFLRLARLRVVTRFKKKSYKWSTICTKTRDYICHKILDIMIFSWYLYRWLHLTISLRVESGMLSSGWDTPTSSWSTTTLSIPSTAKVTYLIREIMDFFWDFGISPVQLTKSTTWPPRLRPRITCTTRWKRWKQIWWAPSTCWDWPGTKVGQFILIKNTEK